MASRTLTLLLLLLFKAAFAQTPNTALNEQLNEMKNALIAEDYDRYSDFVYPKLVQKMGGKEKMIASTRASMKDIKDTGLILLEVNFKNPSTFLKYGKELQCSLTEQILMKTPKGNMLTEYTMIAISTDGGKVWKFIDTSGKSKEDVCRHFPNLSPDIVIKDKIQKFVD